MLQHIQYADLFKPSPPRELGLRASTSTHAKNASNRARLLVNGVGEKRLRVNKSMDEDTRDGKQGRNARDADDSYVEVEIDEDERKRPSTGCKRCAASLVASKLLVGRCSRSKPACSASSTDLVPCCCVSCRDLLLVTARRTAISARRA